MHHSFGFKEINFLVYSIFFIQEYVKKRFSGLSYHNRNFYVFNIFPYNKIEMKSFLNDFPNFLKPTFATQVLLIIQTKASCSYPTQDEQPKQLQVSQLFLGSPE